MEEEKKSKKIIGSNYGILVILLFATVAFLTDYIIIERKIRVCECPKCEATSNEVISDTIEDKDNTQVTEEKKDNDSIPGYDPFVYAGLSCIEKSDTYCLVKNGVDLKVEVEINSDHNYVLIVNGNRFLPDVEDYHVAITDLQFLNDGYIYVNFGIQGLGPMDKAYILDLSGNVVSKSTDITYILNDGNYDRDRASIKFENNKLFLSNTVFADGGLGVICSNKKFNTGWWPEYDQNVYVEFYYEYIGNGKISELNHSYKTFSELLNEQYGVSTCEELSR